MVLSSVKVSVIWLRPITGVILRSSGRDTPQIPQKRTFTATHETQNDTNNGRSSNTGKIAVDITFPVETVTALTIRGCESLKSGKPRVTTITAPKSENINTRSKRVPYATITALRGRPRSLKSTI